MSNTKKNHFFKRRTGTSSAAATDGGGKRLAHTDCKAKKSKNHLVSSTKRVFLRGYLYLTLLYSIESISVEHMKTIHLTLTVPDEIDPEEVVETMGYDFFYGNRHTYEERFPDQDVMSQIILEIVREETNAK